MIPHTASAVSPFFSIEAATVTTVTTTKLFPLPMTPFEYYYWCDDRPEYPTMYPVVLDFAGVLQREPLERALSAALARHPMLNTLAEDRPDGRPAWIGSEGQTPPIDWAPNDVPLSHPAGERIDLRRSCGLRLWVRYSQNASRLILQVHHACCDGLGIFRFLEDLLVFYHREIAGDGQAAAPRPVDAGRLRNRGDFPPVEGGWRGVLRDWYVGARQWAGILLRKPVPLSVPPATPGDTATPIPFLGFETRILDPALARRLRALAGSLGMTINDLMLRDMFQTVAAWNRRHGQRGNPWIRINMPASVREREDQVTPAANLLSFTFLTRRFRQCENGAALLATIQRETEAIKNWRLGWYFLGGLAMACGIRGMVPWFLQRNRSFATVVLSNVGRVLHRAPLPREGRQLVSGDVVLKRVTGVPPVRHLTRASVAVVTYAEETAVCLRCDPRLLTVEQSRAFLADYLARLEASAERGT